MSHTVWNAAWRSRTLNELEQPEWDLIVVGGGITGAGILREAARRGWRCLLLEQRDFAWGTSSRSSKMVHGGLRYIAKGQLGLTRDSVRERQRLLSEAPGLVEPLPFLFAHYQGSFPGPRVLGGLLSVYDALAGQRLHRFHPPQALNFLAPQLNTEGLQGATEFQDAVTDDARLVMRVLSEARAEGGVALNAMQVKELQRTAGGERGERVTGLSVEDRESGRLFTLRSKAVALATGAWADELRNRQGSAEHIRPLRGSHLVLPAWRLPVAHAFSFMHRADKRPVFVFPWEGVTVVGTTDLDHRSPLDSDAAISHSEVDYLLDACAQQFPAAQIGTADITATWAGVRPVVSDEATPSKKPSDETREHALWVEPGCVTLSGGKLTTFRLLALEVLSACAPMVGKTVADHGSRVFAATPMSELPLSTQASQRLHGRYGRDCPALAELIANLGTGRVAHTQTLWAELVWAAEHELVLHLDDLLLRRTRLGLLLPDGGLPLMASIRERCQAVLGWDDTRWDTEVAAYQTLWRRCYSVPARHTLA